MAGFLEDLVNRIGQGTGRAMDYVTPGDQRAMRMNQRQIQVQDTTKRRIAYQQATASPVAKKQRKRLDSMLDQGASFDDISAQTGLGVNEVRGIADYMRPGYGVKPKTALEQTGDVAKVIGKGIVDAATVIPRKVMTTFAFDSKESQAARQALLDNYQSGTITSGKLREELDKMGMQDVIGEKLVDDAKGNFSIKAQNPLDFTKDFTNAGIDTAGTVVPLAKGASVATNGQRLLNGSKLTTTGKQLMNEGHAWNALGNAQSAMNGQLTPESIAMNAAASYGLPFAGAGTANAVRSTAQGTQKAVQATQKQMAVANRNREKDVLGQAAANKMTINMPAVQVTPISGKPLDPAIVSQHRAAIINGNLKPVLVTNPQEGYSKVLAGEHTLAAYKDLGFTQIPTKIVTQGDIKMMKQGGYAQVPGTKGTLDKPERGLKNNIISKDLTTPAVRESLNLKDMSYKARNTKNLQIKAKNFVKDNEDAALQLARTGSDDKAIATGMELLKKYQDEGNFEKAIDLVETVAPKLTEIGRAAQAASIYGKLTPAGALRFTQRQLDKYNADAGIAGKDKAAKLSPERAKQITELSEKIQKLPDGEEKTRLIAEMIKTMQSAAPTPALTKIMNIWRAGLLTSARTLEGGVLGNTTKLALDLPAQTVAAGIDKFITAPLINKGVRSNVITVKGGAQGFKEGVGQGKKLLQTGIDARDAAKGYDTKPMNLEDGNKALNTLGKGADYVYRAMGTVDNPFYYSALRRAETEQAMIEASKRGIKGKEKKTFINEFRKNLDNENQALAVAKAEEAVFQNDTSLGTIAAKLKNAPQSIKDPQSRAVAQALADFLVPFVKIPSAVATALVDYSPAGPLIQIAKQGVRKELDIENLNKSIGKGTVGTIGGVWLGSSLYTSGNLTLEAPSDADERQLWELEGKQPFSVKVGDKWRKLNYLQPLGSLMAVGGGYVRAKEQKESSPLTAATFAGLKSVTDQSFLKGVSGAMAAVQDPSQSAQTFVNSTVGSVIPNIVKDVARATDSKERETNTPIDALRAGIPGLRQLNLEKRDPFGKAIDTKQSPVGVMLDPFKSTSSKTDPVTAEIRRLYNIDPTDPAYRSAPSALKKQQTFAGQKAVLTPEQLNQYKKLVGEPAFETLKSTITNDAYKKLSDSDKAKKISELISATRNNNKKDFTSANALKDKEGNILDFSKSKFTDKKVALKATKAGGGSTTEVSPTLAKSYKDTLDEFDALDTTDREKKFYKENDAEFRYEAAKYENKKASGTLSQAETIRAEDKLAKLQAGATFSKETRDLYSLSKKQLTALIDNGKLTEKQAQDILAYGDALKGIDGYNKFKDKNGNVAIRPKGKSSGGRKSSGKKGTGKGKAGSKKQLPSDDSTSTIALVSSLSKKVANTKVAKRSLPKNGGISNPGIKAYKKVAKTNVSMTRKA